MAEDINDNDVNENYFAEYVHFDMLAAKTAN